jgi:hypothetical protein
LIYFKDTNKFTIKLFYRSLNKILKELVEVEEVEGVEKGELSEAVVLLNSW